MDEKFAEALREIGILDREQFIFALAPGLRAGYPPPNLRQLIERVDCPICQKIMVKAWCFTKIIAMVEKQVDDLRRPVRKKNKARQEKYERRKNIFFFGFFVRKPHFYPEPGYKDEPWYVEKMKQINDLSAELAVFRDQDRRHWGDDESRKISQELTDIFVKNSPRNT